MEEIQQIQRMLERRTQIEEEAIELTAQCRFAEADSILQSMPEFPDRLLRD